MPGQVLSKRCSSPSHIGDELLPLEAFHRKSSSKDGRKSRCKECVARGYRDNPRVREQQKARSQRWYAKNGEKFKESQRRRYREDPEYRRRVLEDSQRWQRENFERVRERAKRWRAENPEKYREYSARYRKRHRDRIYQRHRRWMQAHREQARKYTARYYEANREYYYAARILRRTRERNNGGNVTAAKLKARWDYFAGRCWMCGADAEHMDHVKPVAKGGGSWASNLRPACGPCNRKKRDQWPFTPDGFSAILTKAHQPA